MDDFQMAFHYGDNYPEWGSSPRRPLVRFDGAHQGEWLDSVVGRDLLTGKPCVVHVVRCELCIFAHIFPLPSSEALAQYYARTFYEQSHKDYIARYEADAAWWAACMHGPVLHTMATLLGRAPHEHGCLLDVGAGPGLLLREAKRQGWSYTLGIEPSQVCAEYLVHQGHDVWASSLHDYGLSVRDAKGMYDGVVLWETLEHMINPEETLLEVYALLKPGGVVAIVVPNDYTPAQYAACSRFDVPHWWVAPPEHITYFSPKTLQLLVRRCGFTIQHMRTTFPMIEHFMLEQGRCYVGNDSLGRACHQDRILLELEAVAAGRWGELEAQYTANMQHREGREIVCIAQKEARV